MTTEHRCTKESPMPIEIAGKVVELQQWWVHEDVDLINECDDVDRYKCLNCGHEFNVWYSM